MIWVHSSGDEPEEYDDKTKKVARAEWAKHRGGGGGGTKPSKFKVANYQLIDTWGHYKIKTSRNQKEIHDNLNSKELKFSRG